MWRLASARTTPLCMEPEEHAAVTACGTLPKRYFVPKPPAPPGPPNRAHLAHVHWASRRGRLAERSPTCPLRPRADRRCRWCQREVAGATPRAHLRTRGLVSAGRWSAAGAVERTGHRPPAQAAAGARQRGGAVPPPRRPRMASLRGGGHRPPPARPPFPPISTCGTGAVTKKICCFVGKGAERGGGAPSLDAGRAGSERPHRRAGTRVREGQGAHRAAESTRDRPPPEPLLRTPARLQRRAAGRPLLAAFQLPPGHAARRRWLTIS